MAASVVVDASFLVTLHSRRETNHAWAARRAGEHPPPWHTCEAVISETFYLLGAGAPARVFAALLQRGALITSFRFAESSESVLALMEKYSDIQISFADACLVRMTELLPDPLLLTTDTDFRVYRRQNRRG